MMNGAAVAAEKFYTLKISSTKQEISFKVPCDHLPPPKIRLCSGSVSIAVFNYQNDIDSYIELTKDELERFDRGLKTGQCRHNLAPSISRDHNSDERFHKTLAKLQKKLKEKKNNENYCSYCEEYGQVLNIEMHPNNAPAIHGEADEEKIEKQNLILTEPKPVSLGSSSIQITWGECPENKQLLDECIFELQMTKSKNSAFQTKYRGNDKTFTVKDLSPGTKYYFRVRAIKGSVEGPYSADVTTLTDATVPTTPDQPYITNKSKTCVIVKWTIKSDNGSPIKTYILQSNIGKDEFNTIYEGPSKHYKFNHKLAPMETCLFRVKAVNGIGESEFSPELFYMASAAVPSIPEPPSLVKSASHLLQLAWTKPNDNGAEISEYALQMEDVKKGYGFRAVYRGSNLGCVINDGLQRNTPYKFRLSATNNQGESKWSDIVTFTTSCQAPARMAPPTIEGKVHAKSFTVAWIPPGDNGGGEIDFYTLQADDGEGSPFFVAYTGQDMSHKFQDLSPAHSYKVRVSCTTTASLQSQWSDITTVRTSPVVPTPPSVLQEIIREHKTPYNIEVVWASPKFDGGAKVTNYNLQMRKDEGEEFRDVYFGRSICFLVSELKPNTDYHFRVRAKNIAGDSKFSEVVIINTGPGPPDQILPPQATCRSSSALQVSWQIPKENGTPVTNYVLEWAKKLTGPFVQVYSGRDNYCEIRKNLLPFTVYYFRVQAASKAGSCDWSEIVSCKTLAAPPSQVTDVKVVDESSKSLLLQWSVPQDNGAHITCYNIDLIGCDMRSYFLSENDESENETRMVYYELTGLQPSTQYRFRVQAVNKPGCGQFSSIVCATTGNVPPNAPNLDMVNSSYQSIKLSWKCLQIQSETDELNYELQIQTPGAISFKTVYKGPSTSFKVGKLKEQTKYNFRVRASNEAGCSPYSHVYAAQTGIEPPPPVKIKGCGTKTKLTLTWNSIQQVQPTDKITYVVEWQQQGLTDSQQLYHGGETTYTCTHLSPDQCYVFRARSLRTLADGREVQNSFSAPFLYTVPSEDNEPEITFAEEEIETESRKSLFTERNLAVIGFAAFAFIILVMALLLVHIQ